MTTDDNARQLSIGELIAEAGTVVNDAIGEVRIVGTVRGHRPGRYTTYGQLVAHHPTTNRPVAKVPVVFRAGTVRAVETLNGSLVAATGRLTSNLTYGPLQFTAVNVEVIDAESAATRSIAELRAAIRRDGLDQTNKNLPLPEGARRLTVIAPIGGGAGGADFHNRLRSGGHEWDLTTVGVAMGGENAAEQIGHAIIQHARTGCDAVVVCRGGGAPSDLAAFDAPAVAKAIAEAPVPVIVAVGHATDNHVADQVAHASLPTPSAAADWFNRRRGEAAAQARELITRAEQAAAITRQSQAHAATQHAESLARTAERRLRQSRAVVAGAGILVCVVLLVVWWLLR